MPDKILIGLANCLILTLTIARIYVLTNRNSFIQSNRVLRLSIIFPIAGYVCLVLASALIILPIYFRDISLLKQIISNSIFFLLCWSGLHFIVFHHNHRLFYTDYYYEVQSFSGHLQSQTWEDIVSIKNNSLFGLLLITNREDKYCKISHYLKGFKKFKEFLETKHVETVGGVSPA